MTSSQRCIQDAWFRLCMEEGYIENTKKKIAHAQSGTLVLNHANHANNGVSFSSMSVHEVFWSCTWRGGVFLAQSAVYFSFELFLSRFPPLLGFHIGDVIFHFS